MLRTYSAMWGCSSMSENTSQFLYYLYFCCLLEQHGLDDRVPCGCEHGTCSQPWRKVPKLRGCPCSYNLSPPRSLTMQNTPILRFRFPPRSPDRGDPVPGHRDAPTNAKHVPVCFALSALSPLPACERDGPFVRGSDERFIHFLFCFDDLLLFHPSLPHRPLF